MGPKRAASTHGAKKLVGVREISNQALRFLDLPAGVLSARIFAERRTVRQRVVADPVPFRMGSRGECLPARVTKPFADNEERRGNSPRQQDVQHALRDSRRGPVVECERDAFHRDSQFRRRMPADTKFYPAPVYTFAASLPFSRLTPSSPRTIVVCGIAVWTRAENRVQPSSLRRMGESHVSAK